MSIFTGTGFALMMMLFFYVRPLSAQIESDEFRRRTSNHIQRVTILGETLRQEFPEHFGNLTPELVYEYLSDYHDTPKLMPLSQLRHHGYTGALSIEEVLARFYGTNRLINELSAEDKALLNDTIEQLNRIEANLKDRFFFMRNVSESEIESLLKLEKIVDLTDTGIARWSEMGVPRENALASTFVSKMEGASALLPLILWLEKHYDSVLFPYSQTLYCESILQSVAQ